MRKRNLRIALAGALLCTVIPAYGLRTFAMDAMDDVQVENEQVDESQDADSTEETTDNSIYGGGKDGSTFNLAYTMTGSGNYVADPTQSDSEVYFRFEAPADGFFSITSSATDGDPRVRLVQRNDSSTVEEVDFDDDSAADGYNFYLTGSMEKGEVYYFVVSHYSNYREDLIPIAFDYTSLKEGWNELPSGEKCYCQYGELLMDKWKKIDGYWYYFKNNGAMCRDEIHGVWEESISTDEYYGFDKDGHMVKGIATVDGLTYYFSSTGAMETGFIKVGDDTYFFDDAMVTNHIIFKEDRIFYFGKDGKLKDSYSQKPGWKKLNGLWYYYDGSDFVEEGWRNIDSKWYYFYDQHPYMNVMRSVYTREGTGTTYASICYFNADGIAQTGWQKVDGLWYYFNQYGYRQDGFITDSKGDHYYADFGDGIVYDEVMEYYDGATETTRIGYFDKSGKLQNSYALKTGWMKFNGKWYYCDETKGGLVRDAIISDGGYEYYLNAEGVMTTNGTYWLGDVTIRVDAKGHMVYGWYKNSFGCWEYYTDEGIRIEYDIAMIKGKYYFFLNGVMQTDCSIPCNGKIYVFDSKGNCTSSNAIKDGWMKLENDWYYFVGGEPVCNEMRKIGNYTYGFYSSGAMIDNGSQVFNGKRYAFDANGHLVYGWYTATYGETYYADSMTGELFRSGLYEINGKPYLFDDWGTLVKNRVYYDSSKKTLYAWDSVGNSKTYSASDNGWVYFDYYVDNGKVVVSDWKKIDGYWYYFDDQAEKVCDRIETIGGKQYYFDEMGRMKTGWIACYEGWYYADSNGVLCDHQWKTINGKKYYFGPYAHNGICVVDGQWQVFDNYVWVRTLTNPDGWVKVGNDWYYFESGSLDISGVYSVDGDLYYFADNGAMVTNTAYDNYYFGANGKAVRNTWVEDKPGRWMYYGDDRYACHDEILYIDGKRYAFDNQGYMVSNSAYVNGKYYKIGASGVETTSIKNGWFTTPEGGLGYIRDGVAVYDGFCDIGGKTYYFRDGNLVKYDFVYANGLYFADKDGVIVKNGWNKFFGSYVYARPDGRLLEGMQTVDGKQYYFTPVMLNINFCSQNEYYVVASNGAIKQTIKAKGTGWIKTPAGDWLYSRDGQFVRGVQSIDGKIYEFSYIDGTMLKNTYSSYLGYLGASGALEKKNGWVKNNDGKWLYLEGDTELYGPLCINGKDYYIDGEEGNLTGIVCINNCYYDYDGNGSRKLVTLKDGWNKYNGQWIYREHEELVNGLKKIDGKWYYFMDGLMQTNTLYHDYSSYGTIYFYFGADGTMAKNKWVEAYPGEWLYIGADGRQVTGEYTINGKTYYFDRYGAWDGSNSLDLLFPGK